MISLIIKDVRGRKTPIENKKNWKVEDLKKHYKEKVGIATAVIDIEFTFSGRQMKNDIKLELYHLVNGNEIIYTNRCDGGE